MPLLSLRRSLCCVSVSMMASKIGEASLRLPFWSESWAFFHNCSAAGKNRLVSLTLSDPERFTFEILVRNTSV